MSVKIIEPTETLWKSLVEFTVARRKVGAAVISRTTALGMSVRVLQGTFSGLFIGIRRRGLVPIFNTRNLPNHLFHLIHSEPKKKFPYTHYIMCSDTRQHEEPDIGPSAWGASRFQSGQATTSAYAQRRGMDTFVSRDQAALCP
jgi:hypothetical protein